VIEAALPAGLPDSPPPIPAPARETPRWRWFIHLVLIGVYPLLGLILRITTGRSPGGPALSGNVRGLLFVSGFELLLFSILFALACLISRASREQMMWRWRPGWWVVPLGLVYSFVIRFGVVIVAVTVMTVITATQTVSPEKVQEYMSANRPNVDVLVSVPAMRHNPAYYWLTVTFVSFIVAGLREEMWRAGTLAAMRAIWPRAFGSLPGQYLAIALIAVVFGAMHISMGVLAAAAAAVLGLLLGIIIIVHKSIWPAVIAHGLFDATTMALLPWWMEHAKQFQ
jgi:membrane protease YdiL (CAAX protease family)